MYRNIVKLWELTGDSKMFQFQKYQNDQTQEKKKRRAQATSTIQSSKDGKIPGKSLWHAGKGIGHPWEMWITQVYQG